MGCRNVGLAAVAAVGVLGALASAVGDREALNIDVPDEGTLATPIKQSQFGRIYKTGAGTLTVVQNALTNSPVHVEVLEGKVALSEAASSPVAIEPPSTIASKAAFWLDASESGTLFLGNGSAASEPDAADPQLVATWNDRRDGGKTSGRDYPYGVAAFASGVTQESAGLLSYFKTNGLAAVYFGGYKSGKYLDFRDASGSQFTYSGTLVHVYFVYGFTKEWGYLLGRRSGDANWYYDQSRDPGYMSCVNSMRGSPLYSVYQSATWLNGSWIDQFSERSPQGFNLLRQDFVDGRATMNAIYATKASESKAGVGGDYLCEAIIFTNVLGAAELAQIDDYLLNKWNLPRRGKAISRNRQAFTLAAGTELEADVSGTTYPVSLAGSGTVVKKGSGNLAIGPSLDDEFTGTVDLRAGGILAQGGRLPPVAANGGESYSSAALSAGSGSGRDANGVLLTKASGTSGTFRKLGRGDMRVNAIGSDVNSIFVEEGTLILESPSSTDRIAPVACGMSVSVSNSSFEMPADLGVYWTRWTDMNGWWQYWNQTSYTEKDAYCDYPAPDGRQMLRLTCLSDAYTLVHVPAAGVYEFSFRHSARSWKKNAWGRSNIDIVFADATQYATSDRMSFPVVATFIAQASTFPKTSYRISAPAAGDYHLGFRARNLSIDNYVYIDDLSLVYVADAPRTDTWKIPNGDFEQIPAGVLSYIAFTNVNTASEGNLAEGWTFSQDASAVGAVIGLARYESFGNAAGRYSFVTSGDPRMRGAAQLMLKGNHGTATTTFTPPAGRWRLQARMARNVQSPYANAYPGIAASVAIGGEPISLGSVSNKTHALLNRRWPVAFETDGTASVTLSVKNSAEGDFTVSDDYMLVSADAGGDGEGEELILNGGFETAASNQGWYLGCEFSGNNNPGGKYNGYAKKMYPDATWAPTGYEGEWCWSLQQSGSIRQTVNIPEAGTYRLKYAMAPRPGVWFGFNSTKAWVSRRGVTNNLGRAVCISDSWQEHVFTFDIDEPGEYVVGITGIGYLFCPDIVTYGDQHNCDHTCCIDAVSLKRVRETRTAAPPCACGGKGPRIDVAEGAYLRLDYPGTLRVSSLTLGGTKARKGTVRASDYPQYLSGRGTIEIAPGDGMILIAY